MANANIHLDSVGGNDANDGSNWANAEATVAAAAGDITDGGNTIYVDDAHSESGITSTGGLPTPYTGALNRMICVDKASETDGTTCSESSGAFMEATTNADFNVEQQTEYIGMHFKTADDGAFDSLGSHRCIKCTFEVTAQASDQWILVGQNASGSSHLIWDDCVYYPLATGQTINVGSDGCRSLIRGLSLHASAAAITDFAGFGAFGTANVVIMDSDLSGGASTMELFSTLPDGSAGIQNTEFRAERVRMPASGVISNDTWDATSLGSIEHGLTAIGCANSDQYDYYHENGFITIVDSRTVYLNAELPDATNYSLECDLKAAADIMCCAEIDLGQQYLDANPTIKIHVVADQAALWDDHNLWIDVWYPDATNPSQGKHDTTRVLALGDSAALTAESDPGWTGLGTATNTWRYYGITLTISGGAAGLHRVVLGCHNDRTVLTDFYVDPSWDVT